MQAMTLSLTIAIVLASVQMAFNVLLALFMFGLRRKFAETDGLREKLEKRDELIRAQVDRAVKQEIGKLADAIQRIETRLSDGDQRFEKLSAHDHQTELARRDELHQLREWVMKNCATRHSQDELAKQVAALREDIIRVQTQGSKA